jgi:hypothetical protein
LDRLIAGFCSLIGHAKDSLHSLDLSEHDTSLEGGDAKVKIPPATG